MEERTEIRRKVLVEGVSKRQICKEYHLGWATLEQIMSAGLKRQRSAP